MAHRKLHYTDRMWTVRGTDLDANLNHDGYDPTVSPTTPLQFGSPASNKRLGVYPRSQSMNGRIQKSNFFRSQSFNGGAKGVKATYRGHHSDRPQTQLLNYMNSSGMDQQKVVLMLEKLREMYAASRDQQLQQLQQQQQQQLASDHSSQVKCSPPRTPLRMDDPPVEASTIALLQQKFAQLERYKESVHGQNIQLYPLSQNPESTQHQQAAPPSNTRSGFYYPVDDTLAAAAQQQVFLSLSRSTAAKSTGIADESWEFSDAYPKQQADSVPSGPKDAPNSPCWSRDTSRPTASNNCKFAAADNMNALLHYMLLQQQQPPQPPSMTRANCNSVHQQNLTAFQKMDLSGAMMSGPGAGREPMFSSARDSTSPELGLDFGGFKEPVMTNNTNNVNSSSGSSGNFLFSTSSPLHIAATRATAAKQLPEGWGDGLSLLTRTPTSSPASSGGWGSEASDAWRSSSSSSSESIHERELYTDPIDTSLHL
ncbi:hypothetical protein MPTK1_4g13100 [Marchantia polymorpha subsp. ruderalis]|uniref:Uncharacterized protein n=2 Tax=Marchantia polymorpha TaxID=3197 RepID=A0AAF6B9E9_MARPO|nr:hypothetical protein MARPO_0138s0044 [Marchantia polymorpha]BBN08633.1 hypothetical protein Mp_4g13100 [Marchantia polymorpha subsp. ruderalis]|eukprot:PTQ29618.1 hypothetical protein MARPO_0138s0044 [Marchantia polymorpha]